MRQILALAIVGTVMLPGAAAGDTMSATERAKAGMFDTTDEVACAQEAGQAMGICSAAVARVGDTAAAVVVRFPNGFSRTLIFDEGVFVRGNPTMSGVGTDTDWSVSDGTYFVRVDDQRFELPATLVFGE